jgi:hypothetical protein
VLLLPLGCTCFSAICSSCQWVTSSNPTLLLLLLLLALHAFPPHHQTTQRTSTTQRRRRQCMARRLSSTLAQLPQACLGGFEAVLEAAADLTWQPLHALHHFIKPHMVQ